MIKIPIKTKKASRKTINILISNGILIEDKKGIHANKPGIYKIKYPC